MLDEMVIATARDELYGGYTPPRLDRLAKEIEEVIERGNFTNPAEIFAMAVEHWLGWPAEAGTAAVRLQMAEREAENA